MWFGQTTGTIAGQWWGDAQEAASVVAALSGQGTLSATLTAVYPEVPPTIYSFRGHHLPSWDWDQRPTEYEEQEEVALILAVLDHLGYL